MEGETTIKIYIAASIIDQRAIREVAGRLWELGHEIVGTWVHEVSKPDGMSEDEFKRKLALKDVAEVYSADLLILDNRQSSGGKNVEFGIALGQFQKKLVWIVGQSSNVFHYLADQQFTDWEEVFEFMQFEAEGGIS